MHDAAYYIQLLLSGVTVGSLYALIAIGYTMVYGILRLINFAHGDIFMMAGFFMVYISAACRMVHSCKHSRSHRFVERGECRYGHRAPVGKRGKKSLCLSLYKIAVA